MNHQLITAARCALAELVRVVDEQGHDEGDPIFRTIIELYDALKETGQDVSDWDARMSIFRQLTNVESYKYRYYRTNGAPVSVCPTCGHNWTIAGGIDLELTISGVVQTLPTRLDNGVLQDTEDHAVALGFHSGTYCGGCGQLLVNLDGIEEEGV